MVTVDITRDNFQKVLPAVKQALERCTFFAIDCEMTGLHTDGSKHEYLDDHQTRYVLSPGCSKGGQHTCLVCCLSTILAEGRQGVSWLTSLYPASMAGQQLES
jgi:hypothetical protein